MYKRKILIIGQSLPAVAQTVPYDTTLLFDWLEEAGISKEQAINMFEFEAVYGYGFLGHTKNGGHKIPNKKQMSLYFENVLRSKLENFDRVWIIGSVAKKFIDSQVRTWSCTQKRIHTIHPSKRNLHQYRLNKDSILNSIKKIISE